MSNTTNSIGSLLETETKRVNEELEWEELVSALNRIVGEYKHWVESILNDKK